MEDSVNPRNQGIKESRNQRYECHLDIPPNQRRIRVWNSAKSTV